MIPSTATAVNIVAPPRVLQLRKVAVAEPSAAPPVTKAVAWCG